MLHEAKRFPQPPENEPVSYETFVIESPQQLTVEIVTTDTLLPEIKRIGEPKGLKRGIIVIHDDFELRAYEPEDGRLKFFHDQVARVIVDNEVIWVNKKLSETKPKKETEIIADGQVKVELFKNVPWGLQNIRMKDRLGFTPTQRSTRLGLEVRELLRQLIDL